MEALIPVFFIILVGYLLRVAGFMDDLFWPRAERATYYLFFPTLLVGKLATAEFSGRQALPMAFAMAAGVVLTAMLALLLRNRIGVDRPGFSSVFQASIRPNTYVGIAGAVALAGGEGLTLVAVAIMAMIPLVNVLAVPVVARYGRNGGSGAVAVFREIARNPIILACAAGFALNLSGLALPGSLLETIQLLGRAALPMGLLAVGAGLEFRRLAVNKRGLIAASVLKLVLLPLLTALGCSILGVQGAPRLVAVLFASLPVSASSYILARQLGGDEKLMAAVTTIQILLAAVTMPLVIHLLG